jgi:hypothetical protein
VLSLKKKHRDNTTFTFIGDLGRGGGAVARKNVTGHKQEKLNM